MWDNQLFSRVVGQAAKKGMIGGCGTKTEIYDYLYENFHLASIETIKSWTRPTNTTGPRDWETKEKLKEIFGVCFEREDVASKKEEGYTMNEFSRQQIMECYSLMKDYVTSDEVESEDAYCEMRYQLEKKKIAIPHIIFEKILAFAGS